MCIRDRRYRLEKMTDEEVRARYADLCASYQAAAVDQLVTKSRHLLEEGDYASIGLSGGVANNKVLRASLASLAAESGLPLLAAEPRHTGDNAAMIAFAAHVDPSGLALAELADLTFHPSLRLDAIPG